MDQVNEPRRSRLSRPAGRVIGLNRSARPDCSFIGGMRLGFAGMRHVSWNANWPWVRLSLFMDGLCLEPNIRFIEWYTAPVWEAHYEDLAEVQAIGKIPLVTTGIRLRAKSTNDWVIFRTFTYSTGSDGCGPPQTAWRYRSIRSASLSRRNTPTRPIADVWGETQHGCRTRVCHTLPSRDPSI
jgi:hypothetical protein